MDKPGAFTYQEPSPNRPNCLPASHHQRLVTHGIPTVKFADHLMTFISYAQNFEDVLLWRVFRAVGQGFYIDVGAAHPDIESVTRAFYDRGWHGINIEPVPEYHVRLTGARPRDVNLNVAVSDTAGDGTVFVIAGTGLSTTDPALAAKHRADKWDVRAQDVRVTTLAEICREHAPETVHFMKIDVEGAEGAVLAGADFTTCRPWIVLLEATAPGTTVQTHEDWEPILLDAGYRCLWFDGLNRFYAAAEHYDAVAVHFQVPVCVFDDFLRAADTEWTRRISHAEMQAADLLERSLLADATIQMMEGRAREVEQRAQEAESRASRLELRAQASESQAREVGRQAEVTERALRHTEAHVAAIELRLQMSRSEQAALRASTSWRLTAPLRGAVGRARKLARRRAPAPDGLAGATADEPDEPGSGPSSQPDADGRVVVQRPPASRGTDAVHQFHSGSAVGDAITNSLLLIRTQLRAMGYRSEIYVEHRAPGLEHELRLLYEIPVHADYVLILHHSMGFDAYARVLALSAPKILMYHNITPPELFAGQPAIQHYARLGRDQLAGLRHHVSAALADSEFNAIELRRAGFADAAACTLLFDVEALLARAPARPPRDDRKPFTILFVGRVVPSKGQLDLVEAFARFRTRATRPSHLVLVGSGAGAGQGYADEISARVRTLGLQDCVTQAGFVTDEELNAHYAACDLYVSLSRHEGFGVPLVEAASRGIPVLAWPAGAVAYTLDVPAGLLAARDPGTVAERIAELACDADVRAALARAQRTAIGRFALRSQLPRLALALARAGAAPAHDPGPAALLSANMRFAVAGHVNKTYSLAAINRATARALENARPGRVRVLPVEGEPTADLGEVPADELPAIAALVARPAFETGPVVTISQHYPIHVPEERGDVLLAYVFWEESLLPAATVGVLNDNFDAVLAPSHFVARALLDSGVARPVRVVGFAPDLASFLALPGAAPNKPGPFTFLHVSSAFPRKGIDVLLAAYVRAFRAGDAVRLVIKTFPNPHNDAAARIEALRRADEQAPAVELIDGDLDADAMADLYCAADAMVLPSRGEGFNLPAAEAMAAGVPLIVTGFGGHIDFCDDTTARLVRFRLAPSRSHLAAPSSLWAEPDEADLAASLREALSGRATSLARAATARAEIARRLAPRHFTLAIERAAARALRAPRREISRLCVVSSWSVRCGVAGYTRYLVDAMLAASPGLRVTVLSDTRTPDPGEANPQVATEQVWSLGADDNDVRLARAVAVADPDAVMIQHQPGLLDWATLGRALTALAAPHRVLAVTLHNTQHLLEVDEDARMIAVAGLRLTDRVIVHTVADIERLRSLGLLDRAVMIQHGAPPALPPRKPRALADRRATIGSCGFLLPGKGIPTLVEAVGRLRKTWPGLRLRLLNAAYNNPLSAEEAGRVRAAIDANGLGDAVELVTDYLPYDESRRRLADCDVVVLPYTQSKEAASGALHMALSSGACVAVTPIELFADAGESACQLPGTSAEAIAQGLGDLLADHDHRAGITRNAALWIADRAWSKIGVRTAGLLNGLLNATHFENGEKAWHGCQPAPRLLDQ